MLYASKIALQSMKLTHDIIFQGTMVGIWAKTKMEMSDTFLRISSLRNSCPNLTGMRDMADKF